jgi:hypothetical protein
LHARVPYWHYRPVGDLCLHISADPATHADQTDEPAQVQIAETCPVREQQGILTKRQRVWAWIGFLLMAVNGPVVAMAISDDSWLLSVTVAAIVAFVIIIDDTQRRRARADRTPESE